MIRAHRHAPIHAILALLLLLLMLGLPAITPAASPPADAGIVVGVVEHLRLRVPAEAREAWLIAERECWDPWLRRQPGFLGRDLYWDAAREEGVLLIRWASQASWDAIPQAEIETVQRRFEAQARRILGDRQVAAAESNPFPLLESGSLAPVGQT